MWLKAASTVSTSKESNAQKKKEYQSQKPEQRNYSLVQEAADEQNPAATWLT